MKKNLLFFAILLLPVFASCREPAPSLEEISNRSIRPSIDALLGEDCADGSYNIENKETVFNGDSIFIVKFDMIDTSIYEKEYVIKGSARFEYIVFWTEEMTIDGKKYKSELKDFLNDISDTGIPVIEKMKEFYDREPIPKDKAGFSRLLRTFCEFEYEDRLRNVE